MASYFSRFRQTSPGAPRLLDAGWEMDVRRFLERDAAVNLFMLSWLESYGVAPARAGAFQFVALPSEGEAIEAVGLVITDRLVLMDAPERADAEALGRWRAEGLSRLGRPEERLHHIVSRAAQVDAFWEGYTSHNARLRHPVLARLASPQLMSVLEREAWLARFGPPEQAEALCPLRQARAEELDAVFLASAQMHREETLEDPMTQRPSLFRNHVRHRIQTGRSYVWFDDQRRLVFKVDISAQSRYGVQLSGVFTTPQRRGEGLATRGVTEICRQLFEQGVPRVTLYANTHNEAAARVYARIGFEPRADYKTIFVATT